jgi:hypothetical protein
MSSPDPHEAIREAARDVLREMVPEIVRELTADSDLQAAASQIHAPDSEQPNRDGYSRHANGNGHTDGHTNRNGNGSGNPQRAHTGEAMVVPQVPAPPVAAVLRPSTWDRPAAPGEVIGAPASSAVEQSALPVQPPAPPVRSPVPPLWAGEPEVKISGDDARVETVKIDTDEDLDRFIRELITRVENPRERLAIRKGQLRFLLRRSETVGQPQGAPPVRVQKGAVTERVIGQAASAGAKLVLAPGAVLTPLGRDRAKALGVQIERERRC